MKVGSDKVSGSCRATPAQYKRKTKTKTSYRAPVITLLCLFQHRISQTSYAAGDSQCCAVCLALFNVGLQQKDEELS